LPSILIEIFLSLCDSQPERVTACDVNMSQFGSTWTYLLLLMLLQTYHKVSVKAFHSISKLLL